MADDAAAESWFARAWAAFAERGELDGQCLTAARAVLSKSDSWRTHEGLGAWTQRVIDLIDRDFPKLSRGDQLLAWTGMLRAVDFAQNYRSDAPAVGRLTQRLLGTARRAHGRRHRESATDGEPDAHRSRRLDRRGGDVRARGRQRRRRSACERPVVVGLRHVAGHVRLGDVALLHLREARLPLRLFRRSIARRRRDRRARERCAASSSARSITCSC